MSKFSKYIDDLEDRVESSKESLQNFINDFKDPSEEEMDDWIKENHPDFYPWPEDSDKYEPGETSESYNPEDDY